MFTPLRKQTSPKHYNTRNEVIGSASYVSAGKEKTRVLGDAIKYLFPNVSAGYDSHEVLPKIGWDLNRFRLTEIIYMKYNNYSYTKYNTSLVKDE